MLGLIIQPSNTEKQLSHLCALRSYPCPFILHIALKRLSEQLFDICDVHACARQQLRLSNGWLVGDRVRLFTPGVKKARRNILLRCSHCTSRHAASEYVISEAGKLASRSFHSSICITLAYVHLAISFRSTPVPRRSCRIVLGFSRFPVLSLCSSLCFSRVRNRRCEAMLSRAKPGHYPFRFIPRSKRSRMRFSLVTQLD